MTFPFGNGWQRTHAVNLLLYSCRYFWGMRAPKMQRYFKIRTITCMEWIQHYTPSSRVGIMNTFDMPLLPFSFFKFCLRACRT